MINKIIAPFSSDQVARLNEFQSLGFVHPFTCGGAYCVRSDRDDGGVLIATPDGWQCPCGKYRQDWAHGYMIDVQRLREDFEHFKKRYRDDTGE